MTLGEYAAMTAAELRRTREQGGTAALFRVTNRYLTECGIQDAERKWFWEEVARNWRLQTRLEKEPPQGERLRREIAQFESRPLSAQFESQSLSRSAA